MSVRNFLVLKSVSTILRQRWLSK